MARDISHRAAFESHGETYVRVLAQKDDEVGRQAIAWLAEQQSLRDEAASAKRDAREEETLFPLANGESEHMTDPGFPNAYSETR